MKITEKHRSMTTLHRVISLTLSLGVMTSSAQLYLITGSPTPKAPAGYIFALYRLGAEGTVGKVADLVNDRTGPGWIAASQDLRKAVLAPKAPAQPVVVVDFDTGAVAKSCLEPRVNLFLIERWLVDLPGRGPAYAELLSGSGYVIQTRAMLLDPSIPCERSFVPMEPADAKYLVASGQAGVADAGGFDWMKVYIGKDGSLVRPLGRDWTVQFSYRVPTALFSDLAQPDAMAIANNRSLLLLSVIDFSNPGSFRLLVFRKSDQTWHVVSTMGDHATCQRAFGEFVAAVGDLRKGRDTKGESAGGSEWRKQSVATGPSMSGLFSTSWAIFPGYLYLYDSATERTYTIITNQGDSEILLVENGAVYYRASDRLYRADLTDQGLTPGRLLATSDVIRDAHWAFVKH